MVLLEVLLALAVAGIGVLIWRLIVLQSAVGMTNTEMVQMRSGMKKTEKVAFQFAKFLKSANEDLEPLLSLLKGNRESLIEGLNRLNTMDWTWLETGKAWVDENGSRIRFLVTRLSSLVESGALDQLMATLGVSGNPYGEDGEEEKIGEKADWIGIDGQ